MIELANITKPINDQQNLLIGFLNAYCKPSFGSMSKRDIDISVFMLMQDLGIIKENPQIYDVVSLLHITSSKARSLIYESSLRRNSQGTLDQALFELLKNPTFLATSDNMIAIEIDDPLLIDHLKQKLRELKFITDGSFNKGIVKMTINAYATLFDVFLSDEDRERLFPAMGAIQYGEYLEIKPEDDASARSKKVVVWICKKAARIAASELAERWVPQVLEHMRDIVDMPNIQQFFTWLIENNLIDI